MKQHISFFVIVLILFGAIEVYAQIGRIQIYNYDAGRGQTDNFYDGYACSDGSIACCGSAFRDNDSQVWIVKADSRGDVVWDVSLNIQDRPEALNSLVECDDGGFIAVGYLQKAGRQDDIFVIRTDSDGDTNWTAIYDRGGYELSRAVIELKSGEYVVAGQTDALGDGGTNGYLLWIDDNGELFQDAAYGGNGVQRFLALRETGGGILAAGTTTREGQVNFWLIKVNFESELLWEREYGNELNESLTGIATSPDGGYVLCGKRDYGNRTTFLLIKVDDDGRQQWLREFNVNDYGALCQSVATIAGSGYALGGYDYFDQAPRGRSLIIQTDLDGDEIWRRTFPADSIGENNSISSIVSFHNGGIMACGQIESDQTGSDGMILMIGPEHSAPEIVEWKPSALYLDVLQHDTIEFSIIADDLQDDSLRYQWFLNRELVAHEDDFTMQFDTLGFNIMTCYVSDATQSDSITWHITVTDLYISAFTPDTLDLILRRGSSVDFSIDTVRFVDGAEPEYLWTVTNLDNQHQEEAGRDALLHYQFNQSGNYTVEGLAYRGESSDAVTWNVTVRGAIWAFAPEELAFDVLPDSLIQFDVLPTVPDAEGQTIRWLVDGEVVAEDTTGFTWRADFNPPYLAIVQVVVADTVEADTVSWEVTVREPDAVGDNRDGYPTRYEMLSVSPNPFNSTLTIRFDVGARHAVPLQIAIHDISGRMVAEIASPTDVFARNEETKQSVGGFAKTSSVVWDASSIPAGVYFVRLQSGREIATKKVVLMK